MVTKRWCGWIKCGFDGTWLCVCRHQEYDMCWTMLRQDDSTTAILSSPEHPQLWYSMVVLPREESPVCLKRRHRNG